MNSLKPLERPGTVQISSDRFTAGLTKFSLIVLLCTVGMSCINTKRVLDTRPAEGNAQEMEVKAEEAFALMPRTTETALSAFRSMAEAARQSQPGDSRRFARLYRASWFAIWLLYHGNHPDKSQIAEEAITLCNTAIQMEPGRVEGYYYRSMAIGLFAQENKLYGRDAMGKVRADAERAMEIDPAYDFGGPARVLGGLYLRAPGPPAGVGSALKAHRVLLEALELAPHYPENLLFMAEASLKLRRKAEALTYLQKAAEQIPIFGDAADQGYWTRRLNELKAAAEG